MRIYAPSTKRAHGVSSGLLRFSSPAMRERLTYVVPAGERGEYERALGRIKFEGQVVECPERGIAPTRRWIGEQCDESEFLMLDDDLWFFRRAAVDKTSLIPATSGDVDQMLAMVELKLVRYAHVGISAREGNNRLGTGGPETVKDNTRTLRALAYQTEEFLRCEHGRVTVMEDFDVNLQLLRRGLPNANLVFWAQDQRQTNAPGGCSTYRTHAVHEESARKLAELHAPFVALRQKQNKTGGAFGVRTEVTIHWKKAFESARRST